MLTPYGACMNHIHAYSLLTWARLTTTLMGQYHQHHQYSQPVKSVVYPCFPRFHSCSTCQVLAEPILDTPTNDGI